MLSPEPRLQGPCPNPDLRDLSHVSHAWPWSEDAVPSRVGRNHSRPPLPGWTAPALQRGREPCHRPGPGDWSGCDAAHSTSRAAVSEMDGNGERSAANGYRGRVAILRATSGIRRWQPNRPGVAARSPLPATLSRRSPRRSLGKGVELCTFALVSAYRHLASTSGLSRPRRSPHYSLACSAIRRCRSRMQGCR